MKKWIVWTIIAAFLILAVGAGIFIAQNPPVEKTKLITLHVIAQPGDFEIVAMDELNIVAGEEVGFSIDVLPLKGFSKAVAFHVEGGPPEMTTSWQTGNVWLPGQPDPDNLVCVLAVPLDNSLVGDYTIALVGASVEP